MATPHVDLYLLHSRLELGQVSIWNVVCPRRQLVSRYLLPFLLCCSLLSSMADFVRASCCSKALCLSCGSCIVKFHLSSTLFLSFSVFFNIFFKFLLPFAFPFLDFVCNSVSFFLSLLFKFQLCLMLHSFFHQFVILCQTRL